MATIAALRDLGMSDAAIALELDRGGATLSAEDSVDDAEYIALSLGHGRWRDVPDTGSQPLRVKVTYLRGRVLFVDWTATTRQARAALPADVFARLELLHPDPAAVDVEFFVGRDSAGTRTLERWQDARHDLLAAIASGLQMRHASPARLLANRRLRAYVDNARGPRLLKTVVPSGRP